MKINTSLPVLPCLLSLLLPLALSAQDLKFEVSFSGTCISNNANGRFVAVPITSRDWLLDFARTRGISNLKNVALVYHLGENELGDAIEIVNATTGDVWDRPFLLYFGQDAGLGREALINRPGTQVAILQYVYTPQNGHSMGSALLTERLMRAANGTLTNAVIQGRMQYLYLADGTHNLQLCSGTLVTGKRVTFRRQ